MVLELDHYFVHRARTIELKDGNPLKGIELTAYLVGGFLLVENVVTGKQVHKMQQGS
jgi:hypothetical protein